MEPVSTIEGRAIPLGAKNVDTDVIIPAHWLKTVTREGLGKGAFESLRGQPGNPFDDPDFAGAPILIAGDNFGCGSSREHAAWALLDLGIRAVIAPSFSDIFAGNAFKNGILAVSLPQEQVDRLLEVARTEKTLQRIDLDLLPADPEASAIPVTLRVLALRDPLHGLIGYRVSARPGMLVRA